MNSTNNTFPVQSTARVSRITIYPVKSLQGIDIDTATITSGGSLQWDRMYCMKDANGKYINGKREEKVFSIQLQYLPGEPFMGFSFDGSPFEYYSPDNDRVKLEKRLSDFFGKNVFFLKNENSGFPDDTDAYGPTIASQASLEEVASWFPGISPDEIHKRFRTNIIIENVPPFWEDNLFGNSGEHKSFFIGGVRFKGINPCARCSVPPRNPVSGEIHNNFQRIFMQKRRETLPSWSNRDRFDHFYRFAVNTIISKQEAGKKISCGDLLKI